MSINTIISTTQTGLEPVTSAVTGRRSNQLSHWAIKATCTFKTPYRFRSKKPFWSSPRSISSSQLHALLHFHPCPIYLVVFKGSYFLAEWDISS